MVNEIKHDEAKRVFRIYCRGEDAGYLAYEKDGDVMEITHTVVDPRFRGNGLGKELVDCAMRFAEDRKMEILPTCSYARRVVSERKR